MLTLIKRDFQSIKNVMMIFLIVLILYAIFIFFGFSHERDFFGAMFFSMLLSVFFGYGFVSQMCVVEELNGVRTRLRKMPISKATIVLSRYVSAVITIVGLMFIFSFLSIALFAVQGINPSVSGFENMNHIFYVLFGVILLLFSIYLPFYFGKTVTAASWASRIALVVWGILAFQVVSSRSFQQSLFHQLELTFFISSIVIFVFSSYISYLAYEKYLSSKRLFKLLTSFTIFVFLFYSLAIVVTNWFAA